MKLVLKLLLALVLLAVLGAGAGAAYFFGLLPKKRPPTDVKAPNTPEAIARGAYLANHVMGCVGCHSKVDVNIPGDPLVPGTTLGGRDFGVFPGFPGRIIAPNITNHEDGIGKWTDGEVLRAMREGISRDGSPLFPMMPYQTFGTHVSDEDALALIAYVRSVPPLGGRPGRTTVNFPVSVFMRAAPKPVEKAAGAAPAPSDKVARGKWLLAVASCGDCHTPMEKGKRIAGKEFAGGNKFEAKTFTVYSANLTSDKATGLGAWSDEDLMRVLNEGVGKSGRPLYVMPWQHYKGMTDEDKQAIVAGLRSLQPIANVVPAAVFK